MMRNKMVPDDNENIDDDNDSTTIRIANGTMQSERSSAENSPDNQRTKKETRTVLLIKVASVTVLLLAAVIVSVVVFINGKKDDDTIFRHEFGNYAAMTLDTFQENIGRAITSVDFMSVSMTSYVLGTGLRWPNVTFPYFEASAVQSSRLAGTSTIGFSPLVSNITRKGWEEYSNRHQHWIQDSSEWKKDHPEFYGSEVVKPPRVASVSIPQQIYRLDNSGKPVVEYSSSAYYAPVWQVHPIPLDEGAVNFDLLTHAAYKTPLNTLIDTKSAVISDFLVLVDDPAGPSDTSEFPVSTLFYPVYRDFNKASVTLGGFLTLKLLWREYLERAVPSGGAGGIVVLRNTCGQYRTFEVEGNKAFYLGEGDLHDVKFDSLVEQRDLWTFLNSLPGSSPMSEVGCHFSIEMYPSGKTSAFYATRKPAIYVAVVVAIFAFCLIVLLAYDYGVTRPIRALKQEAARSSAIVSSFFPPNVRERLLRGTDTPQLIQRANVTNTTPTAPSTPSKSVLESKQEFSTVSHLLSRVGESPKLQLKKFLNTKGEYSGGGIHESKPIADLFPNTTIFFADIANFTAWSSAREPSQVFYLLENLFGEMDAVARRKGVFKVETVGDCYMAVTGLPDPQDDHVVIMASFARACLKIMTQVIGRVKDTLGPETAGLSLRIGLHSGPVTAGVLRGEKSRFQLFGDTVNTASRMESTGMSNRIHLSQDSAEWLIAAGKASWIKPREDLVNAKGKGKMQTYWLVSRDDSKISGSPIDCHGSVTSTTCHESCKVLGTSHEYASPAASIVPCDLSFQPKTHRRDSLVSCISSTTNSSMGDSHHKLVEWTVEILLALLKALVARRSIAWRLKLLKGSLPMFELPDAGTNMDLMDDVRKPIAFPSSDEDHEIHFLEDIVEADNMEIPTIIIHQLRDYVATISTLYHSENHFHNFEHASHVVMSADRLLKRLLDVHPNQNLPIGDNGLFGPAKVEIDELIGTSFARAKGDPASAGTGGDGHQSDEILSLLADPLTRFAIVFSAMIHDVNHPGVDSNLPGKLTQSRKRCNKEGERIASDQYNAFRFAWDLLLSEQYGELRQCILATPSDAQFFRQVVLHCVMGANSTEKVVVSQRRKNWAIAFHQPEQHESMQPSTLNDLRATCIIELLMQAADMAHAMQTWHIYQKWAEKLYLECYCREVDLKIFDARGNGDACKTEQVLQTGPSPARDMWYEGELEFFDKRVIPVANKLKECGLLGSASDVYLNNAIANRQDWMLQGKEVIAGMISLVQEIGAIDCAEMEAYNP